MLTPKVIYRANVSNNKNCGKKFDFGLSFKEMYRNHKRDFKLGKYENCNKLAKYIWQLTRKTLISINIETIGSPSSIICPLCITKKLLIIKFMNNKGILNKTSERINKCRHLNKFLLVNVKNK